MDSLSPGTLAALIGLIGGLALGLGARLGNFCTLGALEMAVWGNDQRRLRLWGIVLGVAIAGTWGGAALGLVEPLATIHHQTAWNPWASVVGGLVFGYGMALAGNCGFGAMIRLGGGDLRSLAVVVVMGVAGFAVLSGPLAPLRVALFPPEVATGPQGPTAQFASPLLPLAIAAALVAWALAYAPLRRAPAEIAWGAVVGLSVVWSLGALTWLADRTLDAVAVEGPSFTLAAGRALVWTMTATGGGLNFAVGSFVGVIAGAVAGALWRRQFRWEACDDPREIGRLAAGAALMGLGGIVALGCSFGQGVTGFATLAWSGPVTLAAIAAGGLIGLRRLIGASAAD